MIRNRIRVASDLAVFGVAMVVLWKAVLPGKIYHCTDSIGLEFFRPGDWIHEPVCKWNASTGHVQ